VGRGKTRITLAPAKNNEKAGEELKSFSKRGKLEMSTKSDRVAKSATRRNSEVVRKRVANSAPYYGGIPSESR